MATFEARKVLMKDAQGRYVIPFTGAVETVNGFKPDENGNVVIEGVDTTTLLTKAVAAETYLSKADASATYLNVDTAADTFLSKADASSTYLKVGTANDTFLSKADASSTYLTPAQANAAYLGIGDKAVSAETADNAVSATMASTAISDVNGNAIATTYATKAELTGGLKNYLPLSGGTMTGAIELKNHENLGSVASAYTTDTTGELLLSSGNADYRYSGATFALCGRNHPYNGRFMVTARNSDEGSISLEGSPDGTLKWGGKNIVRTVNGVAANTAGNVALNDVPIDHYYGTAGGYIKTAGGLLIQWGFNSSTTQDVTCSLLQPYKANDYWCAATMAFTQSTQVNYNPLVTNRTTTGFVFRSELAKAASAFWVAIGLY